MKKPAKKSKLKNEPKKTPGRKGKGGNQYNVKLTDEIADELRRVGDGVLTRGIEILAEKSLEGLQSR